MKKLLSMFAAVALLLAPVASMAAGITSNNAIVNLTYSIGESITVSGMPATAAFTGSPATTPAISITTTWNLVSTRTSIGTNLFFTTPAAALSDSTGDVIPAADVWANKDGGSFSACNTNPDAAVPGTVGGTCNVGFGQALTAGHYSGTQTDTYMLQLQNVPASQAAGSYTGVLNIMAGSI